MPQGGHLVLGTRATGIQRALCTVTSWLWAPRNDPVRSRGYCFFHFDELKELQARAGTGHRLPWPPCHPLLVQRTSLTCNVGTWRWRRHPSGGSSTDHRQQEGREGKQAEPGAVRHSAELPSGSGPVGRGHTAKCMAGRGEGQRAGEVSARPTGLCRHWACSGLPAGTMPAACGEQERGRLVSAETAKPGQE